MSVATDPARASEALASLADTRPGAPADAVLGVVPAFVVRPGTAAEVARVLALATIERLGVVVRGAGTKCGWGRRPESIDILLDVGRLNRVVAHQHGDLTATIEAGARLADVNRELAAHAQWLPLDSAFDGATIGGLVATNDTGPLRHRYGAPRDLLIGVTLATADGHLVKAGGQVVKNVAGYDLGKLISGSFGTLAVVVTATFKLLPRPRVSRTLVAEFRDDASLVAAIAAVGGSQIEPLSFEVEGQYGRAGAATRRLLVRFASTPDAVEAQAAGAMRLLKDADVSAVSGEDGPWWTARAGHLWATPGTVTRVSWRPADFAAVSRVLADCAATASLDVEVAGRAALGAGLLRLHGDADAEVAAIRRLRAADSPVRHVTLLSASEAVRRHADIWVVAPDLVAPFRALKAAFDPAGILGAGRGPV